MGRLAAAFLGFYSSHCVTFCIGQILLLEFLLLCCCVCIRVLPGTLMGFHVAPVFSMPGGRHWVYTTCTLCSPVQDFHCCHVVSGTGICSHSPYCTYSPYQIVIVLLKIN